MTRPKGIRPLDVNAAQRRNMALELRIAGRSQRQIAEAVGVTQPQVSKMIKRALAERQAEDVDTLRTIENERMERLHAAMSARAEKGNAGAAHVVVRASERRSKLMGLDLAKDDPASGMRHDYFLMATVAVSAEADTVFQEMERAVVAQVPSMQAQIVSNTTTTLPADVTSTPAAVDAAVAQAVAVMPQKPMRVKVIVLMRTYSPAHP